MWISWSSPTDTIFEPFPLYFTPQTCKFKNNKSSTNAFILYNIYEMSILIFLLFWIYKNWDEDILVLSKSVRMEALTKHLPVLLFN